MEIKATNLWPTRIWEIEDLFDEQFNKDFLTELLQWREEYGPWTGPNPNHWKSDKPLITIVKNKLMDVIKDITLPLFEEHYDNIVHEFGRSWLHITKPTKNTPVHPHDGTAMSIVYWLQTPENSGELIMIDPRRGTDITNAKSGCDKWIKITPKAGKILIFPSYVLHLVEQNNSDKDKMSFVSTVVLTNPTLYKD